MLRFLLLFCLGVKFFSISAHGALYSPSDVSALSRIKYGEILNSIQGLSQFRDPDDSNNLLIPFAFASANINITKSCPAELGVFRSAAGVNLPRGETESREKSRSHAADIVDDILVKLENVSDACLIPTVQAIVDYNCSPQERYAVEMYDAQGKLESFVLRGNLRWLGAFDECREVDNIPVTISSTPSSFNAQYCMATTLFPRSSGPSVPLQLGVCVPDTCTEKEAIDVVKIGLKNRPLQVLFGNLEVLDVYCEYDEPLSVGALAVIAVTGVIFILVVIATAIDYYQRSKTSVTVSNDEVKLTKCETATEQEMHSIAGDDGYVNVQEPTPETTKSGAKADSKDESMYEAMDEVCEETTDNDISDTVQNEPEAVSDLNADNVHSIYQPVDEGPTSLFVTSFSAINNGSYLLGTGRDDGDKTITAVYGLKFLSMMWVMYGMNYELNYTVVNNAADLNGASIIAQPVSDPGLSTDTFLLLSGVLVTYWSLLELKRRNTVNWVAFAIHKLIRFSPSYYFALFFYMYVATYISKGPMQYVLETAIEPCYQYWWTNLLYIQNLYPYMDPLRLRCMGWSWFVCLLVQYYLITPFIVMTLHWKKQIGFLFIGLFFVIDFVSTWMLSWYYGLPVTAGLPYYNENASDQPLADYIYTKPHTRLASYLVGICLGYILVNHDPKRKINKLLQAVCWLLSIFTGFSMVYAKYWALIEPAWTQAMAVSYLTFFRFLFSLAVGWCLFACATGRGGPVNRFLSWKIFFRWDALPTLRI
ncbi:O-acyltransferase like protein-like [Ptychodera flava]|uniref:O-acyltransferase like protein-like n=1 Tax=Ptychodera flava TaxID=63121 RepID=UPI00396A2F44